MVVLLGAAAFGTAWWLTTRPLLLALDWDNAFHHWQIEKMLRSGERDGCGHGQTLWTCGYTAHMALEPVYGVAAAIVRRSGGATLDGMRLVNALGVAAAAASLTLLIRHAGAPVWASVLIVGSWLATATVVFLIRTVEDDCVSLGWMAALFLAAARADTRWNVSIALVIGFVLAAGALTNWPVLVWTPVLLAAAFVYARPEVRLLDRRRLLWGAAILCGLAAGLAVWGVWLTSYDGEAWGWRRYLEVLAMSPNQDITLRAGTVDGLLRYIAVYPLDTVLPPGWYPARWLEAAPVRWRAVGLILIVLVFAGTLWPLRRGVRTATRRGRIVSLSCLGLVVCTFPAAWKFDLAQHERMNHVPLCLAALAAAALAGPAALPARRLPAMLVSSAIAALFAVNMLHIVRAPRNQSWLARFEAARTVQPGKTFVYAESEFDPGAFDKLESLAMAIPDHVVISPAGAIRQWPFTPVNHVMRDDYLKAPPERPLLSEAAAALLSAP